MTRQKGGLIKTLRDRKVKQLQAERNLETKPFYIRIVNYLVLSWLKADEDNATDLITYVEESNKVDRTSERLDDINTQLEYLENVEIEHMVSTSDETLNHLL